jgi:hypothetical protein
VVSKACFCGKKLNTLFVGACAFSNIFLPVIFGVPTICEMVEHRCVYVVLMYITRYVHVIFIYIPTFAICTPTWCEIVKHRYVYIVVMYIQHFFISLLWIYQHDSLTFFCTSVFAFPTNVKWSNTGAFYVVLMYITRYVHDIVIYIPTFAICTPPWV